MGHSLAAGVGAAAAVDTLSALDRASSIGRHATILPSQPAEVQVRGADFFKLLERLIGAAEAARCTRKICSQEQLDDTFLGRIANFEAVAFYVYATANGWHSAINAQLWAGRPSTDVVAFAQILNAALGKIPAIAGTAATVYRGYQAGDLNAFNAVYVLDGIVDFPGFTSASFSQTGAFGGNVLFIIRASSARAIWWLSPNYHEEEALLPTDCRFQVLDKQIETLNSEPVRLVIVLREITQRP